MNKIVSTMMLITLPVWYQNSPTCTTYRGNDLTACFQNETSGKLNEYAFMITNHYNNGNWGRSVTPLNGTQHGYYISVSTSKADLEKNKLERVEYAIVKGDARTPEIIPGCKIEVSANAEPKIIRTIVGSVDTIHC